MNEPMPLHEQAQRYGLLPSQHEHRVKLLREMNIHDGDSILEIGCGQGDCTAALALLYPSSRITAIDPAPSDYGGPETLGQAQTRIKTYDIGSRIDFVQAAPVAHLSNVEDGAYDVALMCHSLWYFANSAEVVSTMEALKGKAEKLCIAEWALKSDSREGDVHVQVAFARATCEAHVPDTTQNIRSLLSPGRIKQCALESGWALQREMSMPSSPRLEDAKWELDMLLGTKFGNERLFMKRVKEHVQEERIHLVLEGMLESVKNSVEAIGGEEHVRCMDVWIGSFAR
ncbi:hypothetical protein PMIN06_004480 [Paraphaeosphaeria minitans]|uniref:SAM dependent methyltransferase n=1 Tax=Paraphaeosphaeria minitans TaxID=565426 RepID=A0A9P6GFS0_9PLEO|nr:putative SAM dependent methyltransferase [Paraphaeosphaeria minitans]